MIKVKTDFKDFQSGMARIRSAIVEGTKKGMQEAMEQFREDAFNVSPSVPELTGDLKDAHKIKITKTAQGVQGELIIRGIPYAAAVHAGVTPKGVIVNWTKPGSGAFWLTSKSLMFHKKYDKIIAQEVVQKFRTIKVRGHFRHFGTTWVAEHTRRIKVK